MSKRNGSFTFTFNKYNQDVKALLEQKLKEDPYFVRTNYMCEAVRFYEAFKSNNVNSNDLLSTLLLLTNNNNMNKSVTLTLPNIQNDYQEEEDTNIIHTSMDFQNVSDDDCNDD